MVEENRLGGNNKLWVMDGHDSDRGTESVIQNV
jgi:hypothetical protein